MGTRRLKTPSLSYYLDKRNRIIFVVIFGFILLVTIAFFGYFIQSIYSDLFQSIAFIYGVSFLIGLLVAKQMMFTISMYTHYYRMIDENNAPFDVVSHPYDPSFHNVISQQQLTLGVDRPSYQILYRKFAHLPYVKRTGPSLIWLVITKTNVDTYDSRIEDDMTLIKSKMPESAKLQNEITLVFHQVETWRDEKKRDFQNIVNFYLQNRAMITIPCAVIPSKKQMYALRPKKQFPNKYYYVAIQFLRELTAATMNIYE